MFVSSLKSVSVKSKNQTVKDFKSVTASSFGVKITREKLSAPLKYLPVYTPKNISGISKLFTAWGDIYINYNDGSLNKLTADGERILHYKQNATFLVIPAIYNGERTVLIKENDDIKVLYGGIPTDLTLPDFEHFALLGNTLFLSSGNSVFYTNSVDLSTVNGSIETPKEVGEIVGIATLNKKLVVVCERAVYLLTAFGDSVDFTLERVCSLDGKATNGTVTRILDGVAFVCDNNLYYYNGTKIEKIAVAGGLDGFIVDGRTASDNGAYLLPLEKDGQKYVYRHEFYQDSDEFIKTQNNAVCDGYAIFGGVVVSFTENQTGSIVGNAEWQSKEITFDGTSKTTLLKVAPKMNGNAEITIDGDCGKRSYTLSKNKNFVRPNYPCDGFTIKFKGEEFSLEDIDLKFRIRGE